MPNTVFVVIAHAGEYSNQETWLVAVYTTEEQAKDHCDRANEYASRMIELTEDAYYQHGFVIDFEKRAEYLKNNELDVNADGYQRAKYYYTELPFVRHVDEYLELGLRRTRYSLRDLIHYLE